MSNACYFKPYGENEFGFKTYGEAVRKFFYLALKRDLNSDVHYSDDNPNMIIVDFNGEQVSIDIQSTKMPTKE